MDFKKNKQWLHLWSICVLVFPNSCWSPQQKPGLIHLVGTVRRPAVLR